MNLGRRERGHLNRSVLQRHCDMMHAVNPGIPVIGDAPEGQRIADVVSGGKGNANTVEDTVEDIGADAVLRGGTTWNNGLEPAERNVAAVGQRVEEVVPKSSITEFGKFIEHEALRGQ